MKHRAQYQYVVVALILGLSLVLGLRGSAHATAPSVIINELMYNPHSNVDNDEFLELYNTTASPIDLNGWCFTAGIALCFSSGMSINAHSYAVISPNSTQTQTTYGITTLATYTGKLDNGGETLTLKDNTSTTVTSLLYDDVSPWPTSSDGGGPSLELKDPDLDNTQASSWGASIGGATPGIVNSLAGSTAPTISNVTQPNNVNSTQMPIITTTITNSTTVDLIYKVNFDSEQTVAMADDGAHGDGSAADGVFGATIPAQSEGSLVRFKISATHLSSAQTRPGNDDTIRYFGYAVQNSSVQSQLPVLQLFMQPADYDDMVNNHNFDAQSFPCVLVYGNKVYDNSNIYVYGNGTRNFSKLSLDIQLPKGYPIKVTDVMSRSVTEFHLEADAEDETLSMQPVSWKIAEQVGIDIPQNFKTRVQNNGQFQGVYTFVEKYNKDWREVKGYQDGALYKDGSEKKTRLDEDNSDYRSWSSNLIDLPQSPSRRQYLLDNQDIPNTINLMAFEAIIRNPDWNTEWNIYEYRDTNGTGRWKFLPRDLDLSYVQDHMSFVSPYDIIGWTAARFRFFATVVYDEPDLRQMYYRRLRTLSDEFFTNDAILHMYQDQYAQIGNDAALDYAKWFQGYNPENSVPDAEKKINTAKLNFLQRYRLPWMIPDAQSAQATVSIDSVNSVVSSEGEWIKLQNDSDSAIDISGWQLPEVNLTLPPGSVIAPNSSAMLVKNDIAYRTAHPSTYQITQFSTSLAANGNNHLRLLRTNNSQSGDIWY